MPGIGKTTLVRGLAGRLASFRPAGFYTLEIREGGVRKGFELVGFDGRRAILSHVEIPGLPRVGKYGVDVRGFEEFLAGTGLKGRLLVIDEIGKMECLSERFREFISGVLGSDVSFVATIALKGDGFIDKVKRRSDVTLLTMTYENRDSLLEEIAGMVEGRVSVPGPEKPRGEKTVTDMRNGC